MTMEVIQFDLPKLFEMKVFPGKLFTASHSIPLWTEIQLFLGKVILKKQHTHLIEWITKASK